MIVDEKYMQKLIAETAKMEGWKRTYKNDNWKVRRFVKGYGKRYVVYRNGIVLNRDTGRWLKPQQHKNGYLYVCLYLAGKNKKVYLHRLIAEYFVPNPKNFDVVYHLDGDKLNNRANNIGRISKSLLQRQFNPEEPPSLMKTLRKIRKGTTTKTFVPSPATQRFLDDLALAVRNMPRGSEERAEGVEFLRMCWEDARRGIFME